MKRGAVVLAAACCVGAFIASPASARVPHDPCGTNEAAHITSGGLHCGRVFKIPGHRTWQLPSGDEPASCGRHDVIDGAIDRRHHGGWTDGDWDYWTHNGEWILWNGFMSVERGAEGQPIGLRPFFHNWGGNEWSIRVFFGCRPLRV